MGECLCNNKLRLIIFILLSAILLVIPSSYAFHREVELFDRGYEYYLSYQPEKAVETFSIFLKEFPDSFAKDAAMFWLGKSLIHLKHFEEAKKVLSEILLQVPDSPFIPFVNRELETISRRESEVNRKEAEGQTLKKEMKQTGTEKTRNTLEAKLTDTESKAKLREKYMINSSVTITKLGIREVLWRTGNDHEDFVNEQILYNEAKRLNIIADMKNYKELIEKYSLKEGEADYLYRYLIISEFIDKKIKDMPGERVVESLFVRYPGPEDREKAPLANELQKDAKSGRPFEDIYKSYPKFVKFTQIGFQELEGGIKESIRSLYDGEIIVVWNKYGYRILKPVVKKLSYRPFEDMQPEIRDKIKLFVKGWIDEIKRDKRVKIEFAE